MPRRVLVSPRSAYLERPRLFRTLSAWLPVDFCAEESGERDAFEAEIFFDEAENQPRPPQSIKRLAFVRGAATANGDSSLTFADHELVHSALRGRELISKKAQLLVKPDGDVLAACGSHPIWTHRRSDVGEVTTMAGLPPEFPENLSLRAYLHGDAFPVLIALISFLRSLTADEAWAAPRPRACIMFDDPNLHWRSYGYIDFADLVAHADEHNYHAAMATVPLDAWRVDPRAAALFATRPDRLSLLVHGNNHTRLELAQPYTDAERASLVAQSRKRILELQEQLALEIPRVMAAPHGACSEAMAGELLRQGFEAACISAGSLRAHNPKKTWPATFGLEPAEFLGGLPIIPRFRLGRSCFQEIALTAFLGQPIIPVGHHADLADGLGILGDISRALNSVPGLKWGDMRQISRGNYQQRLRGNHLEVRMFSRRLQIEVPRGIETIGFYPAWEMGPKETPRFEARPLGDGGKWMGFQRSAISRSDFNRDFDALEIRAVSSSTAGAGNLNTPPLRLWPICRRLLAESRDRLQPLTSRWSGDQSGRKRPAKASR